jgi:hypothetical protein
MMSQSWGSSAANAAGAMGVSATALAATCAMESNCQNVGSSGGSSATGAFQMISSTDNADIQGAVAYDPSIAGTIVSGSAGEMDPATEAYAAAYELRQDALNLQNGEFAISNPTVLDVRAVYQFGAGAGPGVAAASDSANIAQLTGLSAASLGRERPQFVQHCGSVAPDDHQQTWVRDREPERSATIGEKRCTRCDRNWRLGWR